MLSLSRDNYFTLPKNEASKNAVIFLLNHHPNIQPNFENVNGLLIYPKIPDQYFHYPIDKKCSANTRTRTRTRPEPDPNPTQTEPDPNPTSSLPGVKALSGSAKLTIKEFLSINSQLLVDRIPYEIVADDRGFVF